MPKRKLKSKPAFGRGVGIFLLSMLGLLLVAAMVFGIWGYSQRKWDGQGRFTIVKFNPLEVHSFDPLNKQGVVIALPEDLQIESVGGRGPWTAGVIAQAGSDIWVADSVANYLGISILGPESALTWWDKWQWQVQGQSIQWQSIDLAKTRFVEDYELPDGVTVLRLATAWDNQARDWFAEQIIAEQILGVAIVNTWSHAGLGSAASRVVESMGFKVRSLDTSEDKLEKCVVRSQSELKKSIAIQRLRKTFHCSWEDSAESDIQLLLGKEYIEWRWGQE